MDHIQNDVRINQEQSLILAAGQRHDLLRCHFDGRRAAQCGETTGFGFPGFPACGDDHHASVRGRLKLDSGSGLDAEEITDFLGDE